MRHRLGYRKLNKDSSARRALLRGLASNLITKGSIVTTLERAKELRRVVEPLVTLAKNDNFLNRRRVAAEVYGKEVVAKLFSEVGPKNVSRPGGYTRILRLGFRPGDRARRALIEFVEGSAESTSVQSVVTNSVAAQAQPAE